MPDDGPEQPSPTAAAPRGETLTYMPALDGVRAVSIVGIMAEHAGLGWADGGVISVNVFFVLSGYLITTLLVKEWTRSASIRLRTFWARRARRLLPALFVLLIGVGLYEWLLSPGEAPGAFRSNVLATLFYVANWHQIFSGQSYFALTALPSPLLHTWTLAIEEQFYVLWPLVVLALLRWRRSVRALLVLCVVATVASATEMAVLYHHYAADPSRLYYGTDTRAQDLLTGAALACLLARRRRPVGAPVGGAPAGPARAGSALAVAAAAVFATVWVLIPAHPALPYLGGFLLADVATAAVIAGVVLAPAGLPARALGWRPVAYVGKVSYGLYLWHWPVFLALDGARTGLVGWSLFALRSAVSLALAAASSHFVEVPIRRGALTRVRVAGLAVAAGGVATVVLASSLAAVASASPAVGARTDPSGTGSEHAALAAAHAYTTDPIRFMMFGDSMAVTLSIGLAVDTVRPYGVLTQFQYATLGCDLDPNTEIRVSGSVGPATPGCKDWWQTWPADVRRDRPDVVSILLGRWETVDHFYDGQWVHVGEPVWDRHLTADLDEAIRLVSAGGAKVVLYTMPYVQPAEAPDGTIYPENEPVRVVDYNRIVRQVAAAHPGLVTVIDLNKMLDPDGHYTSTIDHIVVRWTDGIHISYQAGLWLRPQILPIAARLGLEARQERAAAARSPHS